VGAYDEFTYSDEKNVQGVLDDLDLKIGDIVGGSAGIWTDAGTYIHPTTAGSTSLAILDGGNVGIGTTGPGAKLNVEGGSILLRAVSNYGVKVWNGATIRNLIGSTSNNILAIGDNTSYFDEIRFSTTLFPDQVVIKEGNVGIGTTGPGDKLQVGKLSTSDVINTYVSI